MACILGKCMEGGTYMSLSTNEMNSLDTREMNDYDTGAACLMLIE